MKHIIAILFLMVFSFNSNAQKANELKKGEVLKIGNPTTYTFSNINMPRANFIRKKGGIPNYKKLAGTLVVVTEVKYQDNEVSSVVLERKDGKKFFGSFPEIKASYKEALKSGELSRP